MKSRKKLAETTRGLCFTDTPSPGPYHALHMPIQHIWNRECWQCGELAQSLTLVGGTCIQLRGAKCAEVKRKASPELLKEVGPLMKLYQEEVDKLSNR